ncbi:MAG: right-handed parallel beta-helix repeat-containing protein [Candidatus Ozemobacteraceae bacterium]
MHPEHEESSQNGEFMLNGRLFARLLAALFLGTLLLSTGCGIRETQTGSLTGRVLNPKGSVVAEALVYSLFNEVEKVYTGLDGTFYLSQLPAGRNRIIVKHPEYKIEECVVEILSDHPSEMGELRLDYASDSQLMTDVRVESTASTSAVVTWNTLKSAVCELEYGPDLGYGKTLKEREAAASHRMTIGGLSPETVYHARVRMIDENNVIWFSYDLPFKTAAGPMPNAPKNLRFQPLIGYGVVTVAWDAATGTAIAGYRLYRRENAGEWLPAHDGTLDKNTRTFEDKTAVGGRFYTFAVEAVSSEAAVSSRIYSERVFMPGFIGETMTLTASDSPVNLVSDLVIGPAASLWVQPGVEFRIASSDAFHIGLEKDKVEILVQGRVTIAGTAEAPVRFSPLDSGGSRDLWAGIRLQNGGTGNSEISFVEMSGCRDTAVNVDGIEANIHDLKISFCGSGIRIANIRNLPELKNCVFSDISSSAVSLQNCRRVAISKCEITGVGAGIESAAVDKEDILTITESRIEARIEGIGGKVCRSTFTNLLVLVPDGIGIRYGDASGTENVLDHSTINAGLGILVEKGLPKIENNIIVNTLQKGSTGIRYLPVGVPQFSFNDVYGFTYAYEGCAAGTGGMTVSPDFAGGDPFDYRLLVTSALKRADRNGRELGRYGVSYF